MSDKMMDDVLEKLIDEAGPKAIEEMTREDLQNIDKPAFDFSKEHEEKMENIFEEIDKKNSNKETISEKEDIKIEKPKKATWKKVLLVALLALLTFATAISSVSAWRESFVKYFFNIKDEYSVVNEKKKGNEYKVDNVYFGYIPYGYEIVSDKKMQSKMMVLFENEEKKYIRVEIWKNGDSNKINTENSIIEDIVINNKDMVYSENDTLKTISWAENSQTINIFTSDTKNILYEVAENTRVD